MKKLFVSLPMNGRSDEEIRQDLDFWLDNIKKLLEDDDVILIDTLKARPEHKEMKSERAWYLGGSIQMMADADLVLFVPGWEKAKGCRIEFEVCKQYGIPYIGTRIKPEPEKKENKNA